MVDKVGRGDYHVGIGHMCDIKRKEKENMAEEKAKILEELQDPIEEKATETISETIDDAKDFAELLKGLTEEEKREVKGILIGMQISRDRPLTA